MLGISWGEKNRARFLISAIFLVAGFFALSNLIFAQEKNRTLDLSAVVVSSENKGVENGIYKVRFSLYTSDRIELDPYPSDSDAGSRVWEEEQEVEIVNGSLNAFLGSVNPLPDIDFDQGEYYLGIRINEDSEGVPRKKIAYVPAAINAYNASYLRGATIGTEEGNILQLGNGGKIDLDFLPFGTDENSLVLGNDERLHEQGTDLGTDSETFNIGDETGLSGNNFDITVSSASNKPTIRFNGTTQSWQFSDDGVSFTDFGFSSSGSYLPLAGGTMTGNIVFSGMQTFGGATLAELGYLSGATSNIQTQLNSKSDSVHTHSTADITSGIFGVERGGTGLATIPIGSLLFSESADSFSAHTGGLADDGEFLRFNWNGGNPTLSWDIVTGAFTSFDVAGDGGTSQTISDGNTLTIAGGTAIETLVSATDTVTVSVTNNSIGDTQLAYDTGQHLTT
ncbi:MAG: hypothetical protein PHH24_04365, partial [Candidatus Moranbacteria bacterium]|nr:hypothetical protein [Candidatus Moranbacteria bacterium]